ncbi:unnamed protein product [Rhodiola kirilowii]
MKSIGEWIFSQLISRPIASSRPLLDSSRVSGGESMDNQVEYSGSSNNSSSLTFEVPYRETLISDTNGEDPSVLTSEMDSEDSIPAHQTISESKLDPLSKIEHLQVNFLRLVQRFGLSSDSLLVAKVLYRMHLATLIRADDSNLKKANLRVDKAKVLAAEQEATGLPRLDFSITILVLGKTGVGKSATINSIFGQSVAITDAFQLGTNDIREVVGTINNVKISIIDTPGLLPLSTSSVRRNRKILFSIKRFIRKTPPDIVLYFERLDLFNKRYSDLPLMKQITDVFGSGIWFNTILVMTHSSSVLPEGPNGYPVNFDSYATQCFDLVQNNIHQAVADSRLENPVLLVENHPHCRTNTKGEKILPNGEEWRSHFLLLCLSSKILGDVNAVLNFRDSIEIGLLGGARKPSFPHLLSSFLRHHISADVANEADEMSWSDTEEDEYEQLPSIKVLTKSQFQRLTKAQKKDYLDELDYREVLFLKKQLKEECKRRMERKLGNKNLISDDSSDFQDAAPEAVPLPDMAVPLSFDSDCPVHRYRCLVTSEQWLARPVLDPQGWDHDVGFDGINLETAIEVNNVVASINGQMSKDKQDFSIQSQCAATISDCNKGTTYNAGFDVQSIGKGMDVMLTLHGDAKMKNFKSNETECGVSLASFGKKLIVGTKLEDTFSIGKRLKFLMNAGRIVGHGEEAYGGTFEAVIRGRDYPVRDDMVKLTFTALSYNKETVLAGGLHTQFPFRRGLRMSVDANINSRNMGQFSIKTSSTEHLEIALIALYSVLRALLRRKSTDDSSNYANESR